MIYFLDPFEEEEALNSSIWNLSLFCSSNNIVHLMSITCLYGLATTIKLLHYNKGHLPDSKDETRTEKRRTGLLTYGHQMFQCGPARSKALPFIELVGGEQT
ncbi:hypothetical protein Drorol1_Dr00013903 [Drosera rotundifolia]